jgi:hypothetical protein
VVAEELVTDAVELVRADSRADAATDLLERLSTQAARDPHALDGVGVLDLRAYVPSRARLAHVLRARDVGRDWPHRGDEAGCEWHGVESRSRNRMRCTRQGTNEEMR